MLVINSSTLLCVDLEGLGGGGERGAPRESSSYFNLRSKITENMPRSPPPRINVLDPRMSACLVISNTPKLLDIS